MKYSELIGGSTRSFYNEREDIEWSNVWIDQANYEREDRILLIGDSTARMVRHELANRTNRPVDLLASSSAFHDSMFVSQIDCFFDQNMYKYDTIFVQLGHHGEIGMGGGKYKKQDWMLYEEEFKKLIIFLKTIVDNIVVESIFYTVLPDKRHWLLKRLIKAPEKYDTKTNELKKIKTEIMFKVANELNCRILDINEYMLNEGARYRHVDHIHFEEKAKPFICKKMMEYL